MSVLGHSFNSGPKIDTAIYNDPLFDDAVGMGHAIRVNKSFLYS